MSDTSREMEKQLGLYADTITGFATAQLLAFTYLMAQGGCFTKNVLNTISLPIVIGIGVNAIYWLLVRWCHDALGRISKATEAGRTKEAAANGMETPTQAEEDVAVQGIVRSVQRARYWIIGADLAMTLMVLGLIRLGVCLGQFCLDCKK